MAVNLPNTLTDHPSLVGIIRFPGQCYGEKEEIEIPIITNDNGTWKNIKQPVDMSKTITSAVRSSPSYTIPKSKMTAFFKTLFRFS